MDTCSLQTFLDAALTLELTTLPPEDIRSAGFFHGRLGRLAAEALLTDDGHFLVRESSSSSERQYVLSCRSTISNSEISNDQSSVELHFLIHEWPIKENENENKKIQYAFDGDKFDNIQALINYHVSNKIPVTSTSGALISRPVERKRPLNQRQLEQYYQSRPNWPLSQLLKEVNVACEKVADNDTKETSSSDQNNPADNNFAAFSSEYLHQLQSEISAISLEDTFSSSSSDLKFHHLPIGDLLAYSSANLLATHLFKRDLLFFGLDFENGSSLDIYSTSSTSTSTTTLSTPPSPPLHCALELLCLPGIGRQFRRDAIVRHETLKYFVVLSILRVENDEDSRSSQSQVLLLKKWLQVSEKLLLSLGDHFAFGAIMAGLKHPAIAGLENLWTLLRSSGVATTEALLYDTIFNAQFKNLQSGTFDQNSRSVVLPFVVQLCHLMECSAIVSGRVLPLVEKGNGTSLEEIIAVEASTHQKVGLIDFTLDSILAHIELSASLLDGLPAMEQRAVEKFSGCFFREPALEELFKTTTLLRYLFGGETDFDPARQQVSHEIFRRLEQQLMKRNGTTSNDYKQVPSKLPLQNLSSLV